MDYCYSNISVWSNFTSKERKLINDTERWGFKQDNIL